jgi:hypothetical protein
MPSLKKYIAAAAALLLVVGLVVACGSGDASTFNGGGDLDGGGDESTGMQFGMGGDAGPLTSSCKKLTCADQHIECGPAGDGCGGIIKECGTCAAGKRCGGPGAPSKCVSPSVGTGCMPKTCADLGIECGAAGDGCGGALQCGTCKVGFQCGAAGLPSQCVSEHPTGPDGGACVKLTCADYLKNNKDCGTQSDGCGGTIDCGKCVDPEFCGGGGPSKCAVSGGGVCTPKTCLDYPGTCGPQPDGCGKTTSDCGGCIFPQICGGGGVPSICGGGGALSPDGSACAPITTCGPTQCGKIADGCGGVLDCGTGNCINGNICGGAGVANQCGAPKCTPLTKCPVNLDCGTIADGCGGSVTCGTGLGCAAPAICGGGGVANKCGGGVVTADGGPNGGACTPNTTCPANSCGPIADGCGGSHDCGTCLSPTLCGGGGVPSQCGGGNQCTPVTQAVACAGLTCGFMPDGCGGLLTCGVGGGQCPNGGVCGGITSNVCTSGDAGTTCVNFCANQATCTGGKHTTITGTVFAPNGTLPLPGALIYVPNASKTYPYGVATFTDGVSGGTCDTCSSTVSGNPLVNTTSNYDGTFTLQDVPAGVAFPIVVQLGRWRRVVTIPAITACNTVTLTATQTRLPQVQNEGGVLDNIPLIALATGYIDPLECVFRKMGIADGKGKFGTTTAEATQYSNPSGTGRIRFYQDDESGGKAGARIDSNTPSITQLMASQATMEKYDALIFACPGGPTDKATGIRNEALAYANEGGRIFATHYNYTWLYNVSTPAANTFSSAWGTSVTWNPDVSSSLGKNDTGLVSTTASGGIFDKWLGTSTVNALSAVGPDRVAISSARFDAFGPVDANAELFISEYNPDNPVPIFHYAFNTPYAQASQCGRVIFSDFHVSGDSSSATTNFPSECTSTTFTAQEKILAYMLFNLTSCIVPVIPPPPPTCTKVGCGAQTCGPASDGCGGQQDCGQCGAGQACHGTPSACVTIPVCTPVACPVNDCGTYPDGCGSLAACQPCPGGQICGGGGTANKCGTPACAPLTCAGQGIQCGQTGDGCGNVLTCPTCPPGTTCGGAGVPNQCGAPACTPATKCPVGKNCGDWPDGCGGSIHCGDCGPGQTCGGGGAPNVCGQATCTAKSCVQQGAECGTISDQCGGVLTCPQCGANQFCNGQNLCVGLTCTAKTCMQLGVQCGPTADGCGGLVDCGTCPAGQGCGAGGVAGKCGSLACTPLTCAQIGAKCGQIADGCGGLTPDCGTCSGTLSCKNGACVQACTPTTCAAAGANCGYIADGCGGSINCGTCTNGETCGYNNIANVCGKAPTK